MASLTAFFAAAAGTLLGASSASARTIEVTTLADGVVADSLCTLREAVQAANTDLAVNACAAGESANVDTIVFSAALFSDGAAKRILYTVASPLRITRGDLVIDGPGMALLSLDANFMTHVVDISGSDHRLVTIQDLTVRNGSGGGDVGGLHGIGGGIYVNQPPPYGGTTLRLIDVRIVNNGAGVGTDGAGRGGGLGIHRGFVEAIRCDIHQNSAGAGGGGIAVLLGSQLFLRNSTVADNVSAGGFWNYGGGGIYIMGSYVEIIGSTVADNWSTANGLWADEPLHEARGGGIAIDGTFGSQVVLRNSTVSENHSDHMGGGIYFGIDDEGSSLQIDSSTVAFNTANGRRSAYDLVYMETRDELWAGGVDVDHFSDEAFTFEIENSILAQNRVLTRAGASATYLPSDCMHGRATSLPIDSYGYNLFGNAPGFGCSGFESTDLRNVDPRLGALSLTRGTTRTHPLLSDSPALNVIPPAHAEAYDQRGVRRAYQTLVFSSGTRADIGAHERACRMVLGSGTWQCD